MHETTMGCDADPVNLLLATAKMGLVDCYSGLKLGADVQGHRVRHPHPRSRPRPIWAC
jgi:carbon-monoxide dehydrogenase catalytic subunit